MGDYDMKHPTQDQVYTALERVFRVSVPLLTVLVGIIAYQGRVVIEGQKDHESRLTKIETALISIEKNRYRPVDRLQDQKVLVEAVSRISYISEQVGEIRGDIRDLREHIERP